MDKLDFIQQQARAAQALEDEQIDEILSESALLEHIAANTDFRARPTSLQSRHFLRVIAIAAALVLLIPALNYGVARQTGGSSQALTVRCFSLATLDSKSQLENLVRSKQYGCSPNQLDDATNAPHWIGCILPNGQVGAIPTRKREITYASLGLPEFHFASDGVSTTGLENELLRLNRSGSCVSRQNQVRHVGEVLGSRGIANWRIQLATHAPCTSVSVDSIRKLVKITTRATNSP
jgi:hypothetical protein